jgi:hypothetical protein
MDLLVMRSSVLCTLLVALPALVWAQPRGAGEEGTRNVHVLAHIPLGQALTVSDIELEQDLSRPFAYVGRMGVHGFDIIDLRDPSSAKILHRWRIENAELHQGNGMMDGKYFKHAGRYYYVQSTQFGQGGPNADLGAIVFDITGLPDVAQLKEVARIRAPEVPGGFHNIFMYKHSDGRPLLITTAREAFAHVYDMSKVIEGQPGLVGKVPVPEGIPALYGSTGYHDMYAAYDPASGKDKFYGGGKGGYHIYDITTVAQPEHLFSLTGMPLVPWGHTFTPTPDGAFAVGEVEHQYAPLRIFDLRPGQSGETRTIGNSIGAWTANWQNLSHNHEVRWPFVFVSAYEDGMQVFNMMDPTNPYTVGYWDTYPGAPGVGMCSDNKCNGAFGVDVRNADGLIVASDMTTGFWAFRMDGFQGWKGEDWGMPNISSVQDWDNGPVRRVSTAPEQAGR